MPNPMATLLEVCHPNNKFSFTSQGPVQKNIEEEPTTLGFGPGIT